VFEEPDDESPLTRLEQAPKDLPIVRCVDLVVAATLWMIDCEVVAATVRKDIAVLARVVATPFGILVSEVEAAPIGEDVGVIAYVLTASFRTLVGEVCTTPVRDFVGFETTTRDVRLAISFGLRVALLVFRGSFIDGPRLFGGLIGSIRL
jgi:hypothetical protein